MSFFVGAPSVFVYLQSMARNALALARLALALSSKTPITFDATLLSPMALRLMATEARSKRDEMDGKSAAHYTAWANLAEALADKAADIEDTERHEQIRALRRRIPVRRKGWQGPLTADESEARADREELAEDAGCYNCEGRCGIARHAVSA